MITSFDGKLYMLMTEENHGVQGLEDTRRYGWEKCDICSRSNCCEPSFCKIQEHLPEDDKCSRCSQKNTCMLGPHEVQPRTKFNSSKTVKAETIYEKEDGTALIKIVTDDEEVGFALREDRLKPLGTFSEPKIIKAAKRFWEEWKKTI